MSSCWWCRRHIPRDNDIDYSLYNKKFQDAYLDSKSGALSTDRFFVDDAMCDGLVAAPGRNPLHDAVNMDGAKRVRRRLRRPKKKNSKKIPEDVYLKNFTDRRHALRESARFADHGAQADSCGDRRLAGAPVLR